MSKITCPITGIVFYLQDEIEGVESLNLLMHHPFSNLNTIKQAEESFNQCTVPINLAIGACLGILQAHKLLQTHLPSDLKIVSMNKNLLPGFTQRTSNKLVCRLLKHHEELSRLRRKEQIPRFLIDSCVKQGYEVHGEEERFTSCFKLWINELLPLANFDLIMWTEQDKKESEIISISEEKKQELNLGFITLEDGTLVKIQEEQDQLLRTYENEAVKIARRKGSSYIQYKLSSCLSSITHLDLLTYDQRKKVSKFIRDYLIPVKIHSYLIQRINNTLLTSPNLTALDRLSLIKTLAWLKAFQVITVKRDEIALITLLKGNLPIDGKPIQSLKERLKALGAKI